MKAFEVYVNGEKVCTAAVPEAQGTAQGNLLLRLLTFSHGEAVIALAAVEAVTHERLLWPLAQAKLGDEVTIRFVETTDADPPETRKPPAPRIVYPPQRDPAMPAHCDDLLKSWRPSENGNQPKVET